MKFHLVTTEAKHERFLRLLAKDESWVVGFDTEAVGPARRYSKARDKPFLNMGYAALQGFSIALPNEEVFYYPLRHRKQNAKWRWAEAAWEALPLSVWAHNVKFDSRLMEQEGFNIDGVEWLDSMLAAWLHYGRNSEISLKYLAKEVLDRESPEWQGSLIDKTGAEVLEYVCHDALNTLQLGEYLWEKLTPRLRKTLGEVETPFAVELGRMEARGIKLDLEKLEATMGTLADGNLTTDQAEWDELTDIIPGDPGSYISPNSAKQLQEFFLDGTWVERGTTSTGAFKTGKDTLEYNEKNAQTETGRRLAELCLRIRAAKKVKGTYLDGFYEEMRQWPDRRIHAELHQLVARTGRLSSSNPNIQNQLARGEYAPFLKQCYVADEGELFVSADYAQIELRLFAELAGGTLLQAFLDGVDLHQRTADALAESREDGKKFNFAFLIYGGGPGKASREFGWTFTEAKEKIAAIAAEYPEAQAFREKVITRVLRRAPVPFVRTKAGRLRWVPELRPNEWKVRDPEAYQKKHDYLIKEYKIDPYEEVQWGDFAGWLAVDRAMRMSGERIAVNTIIQGSAADLAKLGMVNFAREADRSLMRIVTMVHDEVLCSSFSGAAQSCAKLLKMHMEQAGPFMGYSVPILAEPQIGKTWFDVHG